MFTHLFAILAFAASVLADVNLTWDVSPFSPPSVPLAVRSPYLSAWLPQGQGQALNAVWPTFWDGSILGWAGYVRVDSQVYNWLGSPSSSGANKAVQKSMEFSASQSVFVMECGPVDLTATFLSPVETSDLVNLSIPFSYAAVSVAPNDGGSHSVQVYMDISGEWLGNSALLANWSTSVGDVITHEAQLQNQTLFMESDDRISYGSTYFSTVNSPGTTYQSDQDVVARGAFIANGTLGNTQNTTFRVINVDWPVFALAHDLGTINLVNSEPVVYSIGHFRDPVVEYITANNVTQTRSLLCLSRFSDVTALISTFLADYPNASNRANTFDAKVKSDALDISTDSSASDYAGLVGLSVRQLFGSLEITISQDTNGGYDTNDVLIFMRDGLVSTLDVIFAAWPALLYTNPTIGKYLLLPHYEYQAAGLYPNKFAAHDLGPIYPKALGDPNTLQMPLEETGNQLIMALSYTQKSNDTSLISKYSGLLDQWAQYLVANSLTPANQTSSDAFAGLLVNQTNLAVKGIIGIQAAAEIWKLLGNQQKSDSYSSTASSYVSQWLQMAYSSDHSHIMLSYGDNPSWGLLYNLYADKLLGTNLFPASVYETQTSWYSNHKNAYGIPLDSRNTYTKSDWQIWTAATVTDQAVRNSMISLVKAYASDGFNGDPFPDWYDATGKEESFKARPVVGGHLALLLVNGVSGSDSSSNSSGSNGRGSRSYAVRGIQISTTFYLLLLALATVIIY